jgi:HEPN domain-containing protein
MIIRSSLEEARLCFKAGAYSASAVMAGRALEGVCRHFGTKSSYLGSGIKELRENGIIDARLAAWARELQRARNLSAHASCERVSKRDAEDLLQFVEAIGEYVFVLTAKFESYMARRAKATGDSSLLNAVRSSDLPDHREDQPPTGGDGSTN